ncbi:MAG: hypothetical protein PHE02_06030 [Lachnospiraceae bacterium]|nr:hypothetical protein [Lachnospiraceae bacterium]
MRTDNKNTAKLTIMHILIYVLAWFLYFGKRVSGRYIIPWGIATTVLYTILYISMTNLNLSSSKAAICTDGIFLAVWMMDT